MPWKWSRKESGQVLGTTWVLFLGSPETFRKNFGWQFLFRLCIFKTKASRGSKLCRYFNFDSLYFIWKDQLKGWFSYNRRYRFDRPGLRPIARIEHGRSKRSRSPQSPQALTIVYVMFSYNRPNRKTTFWIDSGDRNDSGDYMRTSLYRISVSEFYDWLFGPEKFFGDFWETDTRFRDACHSFLKNPKD